MRGSVAIKQTKSWSAQYTCSSRPSSVSVSGRREPSELDPLPAGLLEARAGPAESVWPAWDALSNLREMPGSSEAESALAVIKGAHGPNFRSVRSKERNLFCFSVFQNLLKIFRKEEQVHFFLVEWEKMSLLTMSFCS